MILPGITHNGSRGTKLESENTTVCSWFVQQNGLTPPQGVVVQPRQSGKNEFPPIPAFLNTSSKGNNMQTMRDCSPPCRGRLPTS
ncbi:hypothetical protein AL854_003988 [Salmonella enterica subsp. enterica]|nr:hypothetical protein [Salmonella enterica subsp. enterica]